MGGESCLDQVQLHLKQICLCYWHIIVKNILVYYLSVLLFYQFNNWLLLQIPGESNIC